MTLTFQISLALSPNPFRLLFLPLSASSLPPLSPSLQEPQLRALVSFALIDGAKYQQHAASMGVTAYPALLLLEESTGTKFMLSGADLTTAGMQRFFDDWNAKPRRVRPFVRSLPEPPTNHAPVHVITGNSYEATVSDERLNVLVNLFAPWCGTPNSRVARGYFRGARVRVRIQSHCLLFRAC